MNNIKSINKVLFYINIVLGCIFIFLLDEYIGNNFNALSLTNKKSIDIVFFLYPMIFAAFFDYIFNFILNKLFKIKLVEFWGLLVFLLYIITSLFLLKFSTNYISFINKIIFYLYGNIV